MPGVCNIILETFTVGVSQFTLRRLHAFAAEFAGEKSIKMGLLARKNLQGGKYLIDSL